MKPLAVLLFTMNLAAAERIIIDTDCGVFGDDGTAITMLLRRPDIAKVEGITVVSGNVWARQSARYVLEILRDLRRSQVPVYAGAEMPLVRTAGMAAMEGKIEFKGAFDEKQPDAMPPGIRAENAVSYITRTIQSSPGQITIVALGPMTNIAMALRLRPALAGMIRRLVFMGGQFRVPGNASGAAEFNFWFDPEAAQVVLRSPIREKLMFGLDVTNKAVLDKTGFDRIVEVDTPITRRFRADFGDRYPGFHKNSAAKVSLWDALVPAWLIQPQLFDPPERLLLDVDVSFGSSYGKVTTLDPRSAPEATPVSMINGLNYPEVYDLFRGLMVTR